MEMKIPSLPNVVRLWLVASSLSFVQLPLEAATTHKVTNTHDSGAGSLRAAVTGAAAGDKILFDIPAIDPGYNASTNFFTIILTSGAIAIPELLDLTISGPSAANIAISGNHSTRVFGISSGAKVEISNVAIIDGVARGADGDQFFPAGSGLGGGILNNGRLTLINCSITGNSAIGGNAGMNQDPFGNWGGFGVGGGICNGGSFFSSNATLLMFDCTVANNSAIAGLASDAGFGGGNGGQGQGGGIFGDSAARMTLINCTVTANSATGGPGAGSALSSGTGGDSLGGGILSFGSLTCEYTTIASNVASAGQGGSNSASFGGTGGNARGGGVASGGFFQDIAIFRASIIAANNVHAGAPGTGSQPGDPGVEEGPDISGDVSSQGHNLVGRSDGSIGFTSADLIGGTTNATKLDPLLAPLDSNGGPTETLSLQAGSPAIDAGDFTAPVRDQRNFVRAGVPDIGAYEHRGTQPVRLANISSRANVKMGNNVLIGGFIIKGKHNKTVLLRAIGPSLTVPGALSNPTLELHDHTGALIEHNDDWQDADNHSDISTTGLAPTNTLESAILVSLAPGGYTAIVKGAADVTGTGLVEVYDLDSMVDSKLANISARSLVQTGDDVLIGGFIVAGPDSERIIFRALGPSLPLAGKLMDPTLELHDRNGAIVASNDNWKDTQQTEIEATGIPPTNNAEPAIVSTLPPGPYTAIVRGKNDATGIAVVEGYELN